MKRPRDAARTGPALGPWFDHALALTLLGVSLVVVWLAAYLVVLAVFGP